MKILSVVFNPITQKFEGILSMTKKKEPVVSGEATAEDLENLERKWIEENGTPWPLAEEE